MSTTSAPRGLKPVGLLGGMPFAGSTRSLKIKNNYATAIFNGDVVGLAATTGSDDGHIVRETAAGEVNPIGVFLGCSYTDPNSKQKTFQQYYPASTAADDIMAYVCDATDVLFKVAILSSGTTIGDMAITDIGANVAGVNNAGSTTTGNSKSGISDTSATTATLPFRVVGLVEETKNSSGGFTEAYVKWNAGHQFDNTTGI